MFQPQPPNPHIFDINHEEFNARVIDASRERPILVDFWAEWCAPCKMLGPILEKLAEKYRGEWELAKVNTEQHQQVAGQYGVQSIPNVKLFIDGQAIGF